MDDGHRKEKNVILEALIILFGLFGLGVVGGLERGLLGIGTALVLWVLTAAAIGVLVSIRRGMARH